MPTFDYQAVNSSGERVSGVVAGGSMEQALTSLSQTGLVVERINQSVLLDDPIPEQSVVQPSPAMQPIPPSPPILVDPPQSSPYQERSSFETAPVAGPPIEQRSYVATSVVG